MPTITLAEATKYIRDDIVAGVAQEIVDINPIFDLLPFMGYDGDGMIVNRENTLGDSQVADVGDTITAKNPSVVDPVTFKATTLIGDVEQNNLVRIQAAGDGVDLLASEVASKSKSLSRLFQSQMATANGTAPNMNSVKSLVTAGQTIEAGPNGGPLTFELLDALLALVKAKDGMVDFIMMPRRTHNSLKALYRGLGGTPADYAIELDGRNVIGYENIPVFVNEYLEINETKGTETAASSVYAGVFDDGTRKVGLAGIHPSGAPVGIEVKDLGQLESKDEALVRLNWYTNLALFSTLGLARLEGVNN